MSRMTNSSSLVITLWLVSWIGISTCQKDSDDRPNIIVILVDDLDYTLGGLEPLAITRRLAGQHGATFTNAFVSTPVCCPSRSSILTGKYVHNHGVINNTASGNCSSRQWQNGQEKRTMATYLQANGYVTFYGGKYLNQYGKKETGGVEHVPAGYDRWVGLVGNSRYYNYSLSVDGQRRDHGEDYHLDYLTDVLAREAMDFIEKKINDSRPFFAMIAPPACHSPFTAAPQFAKKFTGRQAPRWPSFNRHPGLDKHWLVRQAPDGPLPREMIDRVDHIFRQRWRTLLSVDQMVGRLVDLMKKKNQMQRTWIVVTSDHGYHLAQFTMPIDKRLPYETDIRVPLIVIAPPPETNAATDTDADATAGLKNNPINVVDSLAVVSIDLAPTILDLARLTVPSDMDGVSLLPLIKQQSNVNQSQEKGEEEVSTMTIDSHRSHLQQSWRKSFLVEYHGEADLEDVDPQCQQDSNTTLCLNDFGCKCQDAANNTFICLRTLQPAMSTTEDPVENSLYCQFDDEEDFVEFYDMDHDPYQLHNKAYRRRTGRCVPNSRRQRLLNDYVRCGGRECFQPTRRH